MGVVSRARKIVRFKEDLEHVKLFRKSDKPQVVSQKHVMNDDLAHRPVVVACRGAVPPFTQTFEDNECVFKCPCMTTNGDLVVHLKDIRICNSSASAVGYIVVKNLAFKKTVACRFTLDNWTTQSEVGAEYVHCTQRMDKGQDLFRFSLPIQDYGSIGENDLEFCVRYTVNGEEFWDNNTSKNYRVCFSMKYDDSGGRRPCGGAEHGTETQEQVHAGQGHKGSKISHHHKTPGKPLHRGSMTKIGSDSIVPKLYTSEQFLQIGALARRYNFSSALNDVAKSGVRGKTDRLVPVMRTGPSIKRAGMAVEVNKTIGGGSMLHAVK